MRLEFSDQEYRLPLVENRRYLGWSAVFLVAYFSAAILSDLLDLSGLRAALSQPILELPLGFAALGCIFGTTISGVVHIFGNKRYIWLIPVFFLNFVAVYAYGFLEASKARVSD